MLTRTSGRHVVLTFAGCTVLLRFFAIGVWTTSLAALTEGVKASQRIAYPGNTIAIQANLPRWASFAGAARRTRPDVLRRHCQDAEHQKRRSYRGETIGH
jgi:hypothetical protein